jgi:hypothetical protein
MHPFFDKKGFNESDIDALIANGMEESIHLDFKAVGSLAKDDRKKREIAKDVSAFANSDGGVIVYGITEENHVATSVSPIDGNVFTKEWLEQVINSNIEKRIPDIRIYPVRIEGDISRTAYIVKIPRSDSVPHQSKDYKYYRRFNFQSVPMEEYEVRELFNRVGTAKLGLRKFQLTFFSGGFRNSGELEFYGTVHNIGPVPVSEFKFTVIFEGVIEGLNITWDKEKHPIIKTSEIGQGRIKAYAICEDTTYPREAVDGIKFRIVFPKGSSVKPPPIDSKLSIVVFYPGGKEEQTVSYYKMFMAAQRNYQLIKK